MFRNFLFNLSGRLVPLAVSFVCIPIYVRFVGVSGYGIVGIYNSLVVLAGVFDVAFSNTIIRELAREGAGTPSAPGVQQQREIGRVFRTLELFGWAIAAILAITLIGGAPYLVEAWIGTEKYGDHDIVHSVRLMGLLVLLQAPISFYSGCLYGLQRHGLLNSMNIVAAVSTAILAIAALNFASPTVDTFLLAQLAGRMALLVCLAVASYRLLIKEAGVGRFEGSLEVFRRQWRFAIGMNGVGVLSLLATQADMLVLVSMLSATGLGYYAVARTISQGFVALGLSGYLSAFPQFSRLVANREFPALNRAFNWYCQMLAVVLIPAGVVICVFSSEFLWLWTRDSVLAGSASITLTLLVAGAVLNSMNSLMSAVQMSFGAVRLLMSMGACFVILIFPALAYFANIYGEAGAALAWLLVNTVVLLVNGVLTVTRLLKGEPSTWLLRDSLLPIVVGLLPVLAMKFAFDDWHGTIASILLLGLSAILSAASCALVLRDVREAAIRLVAYAWRRLVEVGQHGK